MDFHELLCDSSRRTADITAGLVGSNQQLFDLLLEFTLKEEKLFAMRASRVVCLCAFKNPELIHPHRTRIIRDFHTFKDESLKRNFGKLLSEFTNGLSEEEEGILIDQAFNWIMSTDEKVVIKIYGIDIIFGMLKKHPELKSELIDCIEDQIPKTSIAFQSKGNKLLKKLYKDTF